MTDAAGTLYVVSTPIGNMGDFSFRAVEILRNVALILAEDTRHSRPLLAHHDIHAPLSAYHEHNEATMTPRVLDRLRAGEDVALISDAGTPLVSDPGGRLVEAAAGAHLRVVPVPGASAMLAALVASGLPADEFTFFGFPPRKGRERGRLLDEVASSPRTAVLYEAANRLVDTLAELATLAGDDRPAVVARELTKKFEEVRRGTLADLVAYYQSVPPRGEVVVLIRGRGREAATTPDTATLAREAAGLRAQGMTVRDIAAELARRGVSRNVAYRLARESDDDRGTGDA